MSNKWKPYRHRYPDPLGDLFRRVEIPKIERKWIPAPPIKIKPLPGQIREGGKLKDLFDPWYPPIIVPRSKPRLRPKPRPGPIRTTPYYELRPGETFARVPPRPGSLGWMGRGLI
jgi:hypothetical protein